jgi:hypothetical protein
VKPRLAWLAATFLLLAPPAPAQPRSQWQALSNFIGAYPPALLKTSLLRRELAELLTPSQAQLLNTYAISPPITEIANDLIAQFCQPHNCASNSAFLVIDPATKTIWLAFYTTNGQTFRTTWTATKDPATIPAAVLAAMSKVHSPF